MNSSKHGKLETASLKSVSTLYKQKFLKEIKAEANVNNLTVTKVDKGNTLVLLFREIRSNRENDLNQSENLILSA